MDMSFPETVFSTFGGKRLLVGFSGGADSTAALLLAQEHCRRSLKELIAVHIDHHLRGDESAKEAADAEKFASARGIAFLKIDLDLSGDSGNLEARAREGRLQVWQKLCRQYPDSAVVTGHHAGDRAENLLLRFGRGSNVSGLTGLRSFSLVQGVTFLRPLFNWERCDIEEYLRSCGVEHWAMDSSNFEEFAMRNIIRHNVLPTLCRIAPGGSKGLLRSLQMLQEDADFIDGHVQTLCSQRDICDLAAYAGESSAVICRMLRVLAGKLFPDNADILPHGAVRRFCEAVRSGKEGLVVLGSGKVLQIKAGRISVYQKRSSAETAPVIWAWQKEKVCRFGEWEFSAEEVKDVPENVSLDECCFDLASLPQELEISCPGCGEVMQPFGRKSEVKLKKLRVDRHVPGTGDLPVLKEPGGRVIWFPRVRHSAHFPVSGRTGAVLIKIRKRSASGGKMQ